MKEDVGFENTMLRAEKAALETERDQAAAAKKAAEQRILMLEPEAARAGGLKTENERLKAAAAANAKTVADGQAAVKALDALTRANDKLEKRFTALEIERNDKSQAAIDSDNKANGLADELTTKKQQIDSLKAAQQIQAQRNRRLWQWLGGVAAALVLTLTVSAAGYYKFTTPPEYLSAEAGACWQQHVEEYKQIYVKASEPDREKIKALQNELKETQAKLPSIWDRDNRMWRMDDWAFLILAVLGTAVGSFLMGWFAGWLFR